MTSASPYSSPWRDISAPLHPNFPTWPGDPPLVIEVTLDCACGDAATVRRLTLGSHTGTHVDMPAHFLPDGATLDDLDLERLSGAAWVLDARGQSHITADWLRPQLEKIPQDDPRRFRVIFRTDNSNVDWTQLPFNTNFVAIAPCAAQCLVDFGITVVGIDYLSVEAFDAPEPLTHRALLGAGVLIVEGLVLGEIPAGPCELIVLPLAIANGDGAPARALCRGRF